MSAIFPKSGPEKDQKLQIGWFSFSCCGDNTMVMIELMNDHWREWKKVLAFRYAKVFKSQNVLDRFDIAFIEGAVASEKQIKLLKDIRKKTKKLVAIGACAVTGLPAGQRNLFKEEQKKSTKHILERFPALPQVLKVSEVVKVDAQVPGCPMDANIFLTTLNKLIAELQKHK